MIMVRYIGYACINTSAGYSTNKSCKLANCTPERLRELISSNLYGLLQVLKWNKEHNIFMFRISSVIIPFASHEVNTVNWREEYRDELAEIGNFIKENSMRVSMHPGQFVNINSVYPDIVKLSLKDLDWHGKFLDSLGMDSTHRLIIHTGGVYGDKKSAIERFIKVYENIREDIKIRLTLENDDRNYNVEDVLYISKKCKIPIVFDYLHHQVLNSGQKCDEDIEGILRRCFATWNDKAGLPKIHCSSQKPGAKGGVHAETINIDEFMEFYNSFKELDFDIMLETKDKEQSALKILKRINDK